MSKVKSVKSSTTTETSLRCVAGVLDEKSVDFKTVYNTDMTAFHVSIVLPVFGLEARRREERAKRTIGQRFRRRRGGI